MRLGIARSRLLAVSLGFLAACGQFTTAEVPDIPVGPVPALAGTWDFEMDKAGITCHGVLVIDGTTGRGTYTGCGATTGGLASAAVDANQKFVILFQPPGLDAYWTRGMFVSPTELLGFIYGPSWNGQQEFRAFARAASP